MTDYAIENTPNTRPIRRIPIIALVAASIALLPVAGCDTIERHTGFNRSTQTGAAGGAAFGGIVAALANANPAWIAASVILGGVAGAIGNHLGKRDAERHAQTNVRALDRLAQGQSESWRNDKTGNYGSTTVTRVTTNAEGITCKAYREKIHTRAEDVTKEGTACRGPGGSWRAEA